MFVRNTALFNENIYKFREIIEIFGNIQETYSIWDFFRGECNILFFFIFLIQEKIDSEKCRLKAYSIKNRTFQSFF